MWSPRRLLLMIASFAVMLLAYQVYSFFLGHYDGLPPLPPEYRYSATGNTSIDDNDARYVNRQHEINKMLERAFGPKCPEVNRMRSFEIGKPDNRTVFAFDEHRLEDGSLLMTNVSVANFKKIAAVPGKPAREEILTLRGTEAVITFNQPLKSYLEIKNNLKPTMGHILGDEIRITHNQGTPEERDDIRIYCKKRIDFVDAQRRIWCDGDVQVVYAEPMQARFIGTGLEIILNTELIAKAEEKNKNTTDKGYSAAAGRIQAEGCQHQFGEVDLSRTRRGVQLHEVAGQSARRRGGQDRARQGFTTSSADGHPL
jgi:hypothetical protein